ncbi:hypothetical protein [Stappia indica]|uniref:hypothetical protein n=1 Tax=Stappia indica TaxID=538381 RepID=UPI0008314491|nr:hypothetical protein [Stappia indica]
MDDAHSDQRQAGALERFSKHPIWAPIGALGTVAGVGIAIYTYVATQQHPTAPAPIQVATPAAAPPPPETKAAPLAAPPAEQPPKTPAPAPAQVAQAAPPATAKITQSPAEPPQAEAAKAEPRQTEPPPAAKPEPLPEPRTAVQEPAHDMPLRPLETPAPKTDEQNAPQDIEIASRSDPAVAVPMHRTPQRETRAAAPATPRSINVMASETFSLCGHGAFQAKPSALGILLENQDRTFPFRRQGTLRPWTYRVTSAAPVQVFPGCVATFNLQTSHGVQYVAITEQPNQTGQQGR